MSGRTLPGGKALGLQGNIRMDTCISIITEHVRVRCLYIDTLLSITLFLIKDFLF